MADRIVHSCFMHWARTQTETHHRLQSLIIMVSIEHDSFANHNDTLGIVEDEVKNVGEVCLRAYIFGV